MSSKVSFEVQYDPSGRATCKACGSKIAKGAVRVQKKVFNIRMRRNTSTYQHIGCLFDQLERRGQPLAADDLKKLDALKAGDRAKILARLRR